MSIFANSTKSIIYCPDWIIKQLKYNDKELKNILDFNKLKETLSLEDIYTVYTLNKYQKDYFGIDIGHTSRLEWRWTTCQNYTEFEQLAESFIDNIKQTLQTRLFSFDETMPLENINFSVIDIDSNAILISIPKGYLLKEGCSIRNKSLAAQFETNKNKLVKSILETFFVAEGFEALARREIFRKYIERMPVR